MQQQINQILAVPASDKARKLEHYLALTVGTVFALKAINTVRRDGVSGLIKNLVSSVLSAARFIPGVAGAIDAGLDSALQELVDKLAPIDPTALTIIPSDGNTKEDIYANISKLISNDYETSGFNKGSAFAGVYHHLEGSLVELQGDLMKLFLNTNLLYPGIFKSARKMEAEAIAMAVNILKGRVGITGPNVLSDTAADPAPDACGLMSTGGTESILLAIKCYRDEAIAKFGPGVTGLNVVCGVTAHPALDKACHYFGLDLKKLPVDPVTQQLRPEDVEKAIDSKTVCIYASVPSFPHGTIDDVPALGKIAVKHNIGVHVDNCLGGIITSYLYAQGLSYFNPITKKEEQFPLFDLRVPGVRTVSFDLHKYGSAPKGCSIVVYRDTELRRHAYTVVTDWCGGLYATPTMTGSRTGNAAAISWATLCHMGGKGYAETMKDAHVLHQKLVHIIHNTPGLALVGIPMESIISFQGTNGCDTYSLSARMEEKGWHLNMMQNPKAVAFCVTERFAPIFDQWVSDLKECAAACISDPSNPKYIGKGDAGIYGASAVLPSNEIGRILQKYCDIMYMVRQK